MNDRMMKAGSAVASLALAGNLFAAAVGVDWGAHDGVVVGTGKSAVQDDPVYVGDGGVFVKSGEGKLTLPAGSLPQSTKVEVWDGTLELQDGGSSAASAAAPSCVSEKAAFWVDASADNGTLVMDGETVSRWCDRREANPQSPSLYNARPASAGNAGTVELPQTHVVNDGTNAVYFGGCNWSNKRYMQFYKGGSSATIVNIRHAFVVFGAFDCYNGPLGSSSNPADWFSRASVAQLPADVCYIDIRYGEASPGAATARHYLDGVRFDPWSTKVRQGFQLWETHFLDYTGTAGNFFNQKGSDGRQGGDYISEVILFTNDLPVVERLQVQRYLIAKWKLDDSALHAATDDVRAALGAAVEVAEEPSRPVRVRGSGDFIKSGAGELTIDRKGLDLRDFEGKADLSSGILFVRRAEAPALELAAGESVSYGVADKTGASFESAEAYEKFGFGLSKETCADGTASKTGGGDLRVHAVAADVRRLTVEAGALALVAKPRGELVESAPLFATVPNGDFEELFTPNSSNNRFQLSGTAKNHWCGGSGSGVTAFIAENYSPSDTGTTSPHNRGVLCPYPVRQGYNVLSIGNNGYAYTTEAEFPKSGYYEMTVLEAGRFHNSGVAPGSSNFLANPDYDVMIGESWNTAVSVAHRAAANAGDFVEVRVRLGYVEAGTKTFGFRAAPWSDGSTLLLDDIRVRFVGTKPEEGVVAVPNGDFESVTNRTIEASGTRNTQFYPGRVNSNEAFGWTFANTSESVPAAAVVASYSAPGTATSNNSAGSGSELMPYGDFVDGLCGSFHLSLCGTAGSAQTTFSLAPGTYRLRGKVAQWGGKHNETDFRNLTPSVKASVTVAGVEKNLGTVSTADHRLLAYEWPVSFALEEEGPVTLKVQAGAAADAVLADDFELVRDEDAVAFETELLRNGSFEVDGLASKSEWATIDPTFGSNGYTGVVDPQLDARERPGNLTPEQFGPTPYDGIAYARLYNDGGLYQTVWLSAGVYRFTFAAHTRTTAGYNRQPVKAWLGTDTGAFVTAIGETPVDNGGDLEHKWYFRVAQSGRYRLYFQGTDYWKEQFATDGKNHCTIFDGLSLMRLRDDLVAPTAADDLWVRVRDGAKLRLDYDGVIEVGRLSLNGAAVRGEVSAATHPDFIQGRGVLRTTGKGASGLLMLLK